MTASLRGYFIRGASSGMLNVLVSAAVVAGALPVIVRALGMHDYGAWAAVLSFVALASALDFGVGRGVAFLIARNVHTSGEVIAAAITLSAGMAVLAWATLLVAWSSGGAVFGFGTDRTHEAWLLASGAVVLAATMICAVVRGALEAKMRVAWVNWGFLIQTLGVYVTAGAMALAGSSPKWMLAGTATVYAVVAVCHWIALRVSGPEPFGALRSVVVRDLVRQALKLFVIGAPITLLIPALQYSLMWTASSSAEYGRFDLAFRIATLSAAAISSIGVPLFAVIARQQQGNGSELARLIGAHLTASFGLLTVGAVAFWLIGDQLMVALFGPEASAAYGPALAMICGCGAVAAAEPVLRAWLALDRTAELLAVRLGIVAVTLVALGLASQLAIVERYSWAYAAGCFAGAVATLTLFLRWRLSMHSTGAASPGARAGIAQ